VIVPLLPGTLGSRISETAEDQGKVDLAAAHGEALAQLHQATFDRPGPYDPQRETFVATDDFRTWTLDRIESLRRRCRAIEALSADAERYIDALIESCSDSLAEPFVPVLVHHDFSLENTNYEPFEDTYRATWV
jgi:hygromycin-B 7''-O-kinase